MSIGIHVADVEMECAAKRCGTLDLEKQGLAIVEAPRNLWNTNTRGEYTGELQLLFPKES